MQANQIDTSAPAPINRADQQHSGGAMRYAGLILLAILLAGLLLRLLGVSARTLHPDEWFHILAGASWAQGEGLTYIRGVYERSWLFTVLVGLTHTWFGLEGFAAGRMPALIAGVACVWLVYVLGKRTASVSVGFIAAALVAFDATMIEWSQLSRFYTLQTAAIMAVACIAAGPNLVLPVKSWPKFVLAGIAAAVFALIALAMQIISIVALAGIGLYAITRTPWFSLEFVRTPSFERKIAVVLVIAGALVGLVGFAMMWPELRATQAWSAADKNNLLYYDDFLRALYGVLWPLTPIVALFAFKRHRNAVMLAVLVALPVIAVQSLGGMKAPRYILQALPFLALLWAVGLNAAFSWLAGMVRDVLPMRAEGLGKLAAWGIAGALLAFVVGSNLAYRAGLKDGISDTLATASGRPILSGTPIAPQEESDLAATQALLREDATLITNETQQLAFRGTLARMALTNPLDDDGTAFNYAPKPGLLEIATTQELEIALTCLPQSDVLVRKSEIGTVRLAADKYAVLEGNAQRVGEGTRHFELFHADGSPEAAQNPACTQLVDALAQYD